MKELTARQAQIFKWIKDKINRGVPPTVREICDHFGWSSTNAGTGFLRQLESKGYIYRIPGKSRNIRLRGKP